jgi:hypothetical protein
MKLFLKQSLLASLMMTPAILVFCIFGSVGPMAKLTPYMVSVPGMAFLLVMNLFCIVLIHWRIVPRLSKFAEGSGKTIHLKKALLNGLFWMWTGPVAFVFYFLPANLLRNRFSPKTKTTQFYIISDFIALLIYIATVIVLSLSNYLPVRDELLFEYKKRHIAKGLMYYRDNWGWVDKIHYRQDHFKEVYEAIDAGQKSIQLSDGWNTPLRFPVRFSASYAFETPKDDLRKWALASAITCNFMEKNEKVQAGSPWYHGNQLSAWQFDDVSSGLLACLDLCPKTEWRIVGADVTAAADLQSLWAASGADLVGLKMDLKESWKLAGVKEAKVLMDSAQWKILDSRTTYK